MKSKTFPSKPSRSTAAEPAFARATPITRVKLRHLSVLLEVVRTGSAKEAAKSLCVTESAVSKTVKELEAELGLQLFERSKRGMRLTEAGLRFTSHASSAVTSLHTAMAAAQDASGAGPVALRVGAMPVIAAIVLPEVMRRLTAELPSPVVEVVSGSKATLLEQLRQGHVEVVLGRLPPPSDMAGLSFEQLFLDRYIFVVRSAHPLVDRTSVSLQELSGFPLVMPTRDTVTWQEIQRLFLANGLALNAERLETIYLQLSRNHTLASDAVWAASERLLQPDLDSGVLVRLPIDTAMLEAPLGIIAKPDGSPAVHLRLLLRFIRETAVGLASH